MDVHETSENTCTVRGVVGGGSERVVLGWWMGVGVGLGGGVGMGVRVGIRIEGLGFEG